MAPALPQLILRKRGSVVGVVEEEHGLPSGIEDVTDAAGLDTDESGPGTVTNVIADAFSSSLSFTGNDGPLTYSFLPVLARVLKADGSNVTSQGESVLFAVSGGVLTGYVDVGDAGFVEGIDREVFTVELTPDGQYTFTLLDNLDHHPIAGADDVENIIGINLDNRVLVTDTGDPGDFALIADFTINVIDDVPVAEPNASTVEEGELLTVDVQLIVDISGSMNDPVPDVPDFSDNRIGLARFALREFLEASPQIQNVQFVRFSSGANSTAWMTRDDALDFVNANGNWGVGGTTNYDAALTSAMNAFDGTRPSGVSDDTFIYFLSDGVPNPASAGIDNNGGGNNVSIAEWETFVTPLSRDIAEVFALGLGPGVSRGEFEPVFPDPLASGVSALAPISFPNDDSDANGVEDNIILLPNDDIDELLDTLTEAIGPPSSVEGSILVADPSGTGADAFGADGGYIKSITVDGTIYTFDGVGTITPSGTPPQGFVSNGVSMTVPTALGGTLTFFFAGTGLAAPAGSWSYLTADPETQEVGTETIPYVLVDGDGDETPSTLSITVTSDVLRSAPPPGPPPSAHLESDSNGDGNSDTFWRHSTGTTNVFLMNGATVLTDGNISRQVDNTWKILDKNDFNGDGKADILWRNDNGTSNIFLLDGHTVIADGNISQQVDNSWQFQDSADFNGDGKADILWRNDDGTTNIYHLDGHTVFGDGNISIAVDNTWKVAGAADFNGDGKADILWRNTVDGTSNIFLMNATTVLADGNISAQLDNNWTVQDTADFNGDGMADILFRHSDGTAKMFLMDDHTVTDNLDLTQQLDNDWQFEDTGDFNADGNADIAWRHTDGTVKIFFMDGATVTSSANTSVFVDNTWELV